ncbi:MAG: M12 family metallo-peptidase [Dokdonella sp.]|uniref:M12 family metallo-peptidase n=1 Tax=Dokdonella sp. TaxID=2291710 RepID=UPI003F7E4662
MRRLLALILVAACTHAAAAPRERALLATRIDALAALRTGDSLAIDDFPDGYGGRTSLYFTRIDVYAAGARLIAHGPDGERELPRSARIELIGRDAGGDVRAQLAFDPGFRHVAGAGAGPSGAFAVSARTDASGTYLVVQPADEALPKGIVPEVLPDDGSVMGVGTPPDPLPLSLGGGGATATPRGALIAVDVDHELLVNRFGGTGAGNVAAATGWIADLFAVMNVMYVRDLAVMLQQGTTIFRTGATPYAISADAAASNADLNNFGNYWQANHAAVDRDFTMLLSGQHSRPGDNGLSSSGIAWINSYCNKNGNGGSYSVTKVFPNAQVPVDLSARVVGHELGHNFGAAHTHCTSAANGATWPVSSNTIDVCYKGEAGSGCYGGAVSCPTTGPGHPLGTIMSYCNTSGSNGANCGQNALQFHPTHVTTLLGYIASHTPACLSATSDVIFRSGFD